MPKRKTAKKTAPDRTPPATKKPNQMVACWEDDPGDPKQVPSLSPLTVSAPNQAARPYPFKISGTAPAAAVYTVGTPEFRYYATAAALRRTSDFWSGIVPPGTDWQVGKVLPVSLDDGVDLNAFYTRGGFQDSPGLHFFHDRVGNQTFYSGESPDVCCHEMGHAVLDSLRPQLFDAQTIEAAAFHESFGDMSAILSALQVPSMRHEVLQETSGILNRSSRVSRLAEQLGAAIRIHHPDAVDRDCLRNAVNSFFYKDPQTLAPSAPADQLSSEPHSFSRIFTAGFLDALAGMFRLQNASPGEDDLKKTTEDMAHLLVQAVLSAPVVPDYYSQIAAHMVAVSQTAPFDGKYRDAIKSAFVRRGILSLQGAATISKINVQTLAKAAMVASKRGVSATLPEAHISAAAYGLNRASLVVHTAEEPKRFAVTSAALTMAPLEPRSAQNAAESYTDDLFQRGRVRLGPYGDSDQSPVRRTASYTHVVVEEKGNLVLKRRAFECGFDWL